MYNMFLKVANNAKLGLLLVTTLYGLVLAALPLLNTLQLILRGWASYREEQDELQPILSQKSDSVIIYPIRMGNGSLSNCRHQHKNHQISRYRHLSKL